MGSQPSTRAQALLFGALLAAALGLRWWAAAGNDFPTVDGTQYLRQSWQLCFAGRLPFSTFPPGWPLLAAVPLRFMSAEDPVAMLRAAHIANVACGTLMCALAFVMLRRRLGFAWALGGTAVMALLPQLVVAAKSDLSEPAFGCALLGAWLLLERRRELPAGLLLGYAYLVRPEALLATAGLVLWRWRSERRPPWRLLAGQAVVMLPYLLFLRQATGAVALSGKGFVFSEAFAAYPGAAYLGLVARQSGQLLALLPGQVGLPLALLAAWGLARARGGWAWLLAPMLAMPLVISPIGARYWVPYVPWVLLAAGLGARALPARFRAAPRRRLPTVALAVALAAGLGWAAIDDAPLIWRNTEAYHGLKDAGLWLRGVATPATKVADYKPYAPYWANCEWVKYPDLPDANSYAIWARNLGLDYLIVNVKTVQQYLPGLDGLLVSPLPPDLGAKLELVHTCLYERVGDNTVVYRVRR